MAIARFVSGPSATRVSSPATIHALTKLFVLQLIISFSVDADRIDHTLILTVYKALQKSAWTHAFIPAGYTM